jgi:hypothetical protein
MVHGEIFAMKRSMPIDGREKQALYEDAVINVPLWPGRISGAGEAAGFNKWVLAHLSINGIFHKP